MENAETYPLISVIIPSYNRSKLLEESIRSVLVQTYSHFELVIADDGSTEEIGPVISGIRDPRIRFYNFPHSGHTGLIRNKGAELSHGDWLAFLDSDDLWVPEKLELQMEAIRETGATWCFGNYKHIASEERNRLITVLPEDLTASILLHQIAVFIGTMLVRKDVFMQLGGFNVSKKLRFRADLELALRLSLQSRPAFVGEVLTLVREHPARSTSQLDRSFEYTFNAYEVFIDSQPAGRLKSLARARQAYQLSEAAANKKTGLQFSQRIKLLGTSFGSDRLTHWMHCLWRVISRR